MTSNFQLKMSAWLQTFNWRVLNSLIFCTDMSGNKKHHLKWDYYHHCMRSCFSLLLLSSLTFSAVNVIVKTFYFLPEYHQMEDLQKIVCHEGESLGIILWVSDLSVSWRASCMIWWVIRVGDNLPMYDSISLDLVRVLVKMTFPCISQEFKSSQESQALKLSNAICGRFLIGWQSLGYDSQSLPFSSQFISMVDFFLC